MDLLVVTTETVPGYRVREVLGPVYGTMVRSRNVVRTSLGGIAAFFGGKQSGDRNMVNQTRDDALTELRSNAQDLGANAVLAMRFDSGEFDSGQGTVMESITAYGTAVVLVPEGQ